TEGRNGPSPQKTAVRPPPRRSGPTASRRLKRFFCSTKRPANSRISPPPPTAASSGTADSISAIGTRLGITQTRLTLGATLRQYAAPSGELATIALARLPEATRSE